MTHRPSDAKDHLRLPTSDPVTKDCARPHPSARNTMPLTPNRSAITGATNVILPVSRAMRTCNRAADAPVIPTVCTLSP